MAAWTKPPSTILPAVSAPGNPYSGPVRRAWGLRLRVLAAAGAIALVSLITFGVLLNGLQSQSRTAVKARAANDGVTQAGVLNGSRSTWRTVCAATH